MKRLKEIKVILTNVHRDEIAQLTEYIEGKDFKYIETIKAPEKFVHIKISPERMLMDVLSLMLYLETNCWNWEDVQC